MNNIFGPNQQPLVSFGVTLPNAEAVKLGLTIAFGVALGILISNKL